MSRSKVRLTCVVVLFGAAFAWGRPAVADVVVRGTVKYWDELAGRFEPARRVQVEVERDWAITDPSGLTNDQGAYQVKLSSPWFGSYLDGVHIEVYAETPGRIQVCSSMISSWAYQAFSTDFDRVKDGSSVTIDLRFGKPASVKTGLANVNFDGVAYRNEADTAKAFLVHAEMLAHYRALSGMGWPDAAFDEKEVLVPAAGDTSYYFHVTGFINLVVADWSGLSTWSPLPKGNHPSVQLNKFRHTVRHEYSHAIHDEITPVPPRGLNMPTRHNSWMATNPHVAYTEGFADLLPLMTARVGHRWEESATLVGGPLLQGNHTAMEGEVTALLWDVFDPKGYEALRHPATKTPDGKAVPSDVQRAQRWMDGLEDPSGLRIRKLVSKNDVVLFGILGNEAWDDIGTFLKNFTAAFPAEAHEIKAAAFNRDIHDFLPAETPARLEGSASVRRRGSTVTLSCTVREDDVEDRPHVRLNAYTGRSSYVVRPVAGLRDVLLATGWNGPRNRVTRTFDLPVGFRPGDPLWVEINDDMLPTVYELTIPRKDDAVVEAAPMNDGLATAYGDIPPEIRNRLERIARLGSLPSRVPGSALEPTRTRKVDFESPPRGWRFTGSARIEKAGGSQALATAGYAHGVWNTGPVERFGLRMRYRHGRGVGSLFLSLTSGGKGDALYQLTLRDDGVVLTREANGVETALAASASTLQAGRWYDVVVRCARGDFRVSLDGRVVLSVRDPEPLPGGILAFGSLLGSGFAFDDIALTGAPEAPPPPSRGDAVPPETARAKPERKQEVQTLRSVIREARRALREHAERRDLQERQRRALYRLARKEGGLSTRSTARELMPVARMDLTQVRKLTPLQQVDSRAFDVWLGERAAGRPAPRPLRAAMRPVLGEQIRAADAAIAAVKALPKRVVDLRRRLAEAAGRLEKEDFAWRAQTVAALAELQAALKRVGEDVALVTALETQRKVLDTLRR